MATLYEEIPTLVERIVAADLVITGRFGRLVGIQRVEAGDRPRVTGLFEVSVEHAIRGEPPSDAILVRVLGEGEDERAAWIIDVKAAELLVFLLVRDVEPGLPNNVFAPYFSSAFPVADGTVRLPEEVVDERSREIAGFEDSTTSLDRLERLIQEVWRAREERDRALAEVEPAELKEQRYPEVAEMPQPELGGALPATPEGERPHVVGAEPRVAGPQAG
jgi:hypothetical protein